MDKINSMVATAEAEENRAFTDEENTAFDTLRNEVSDIDDKITRQTELDAANKRQADLENQMNQVPGPRLVNDPENNGLSDRERGDLSSYSIANVIAASAGLRPLDGIEAEMHQEAQKEARENGGYQINGIGIPAMVSRFRNDLTATGGTGGDQGGATVPQEMQSMTDIIHKRMVVNRLGATNFNNAQGDLVFPRAIEDTSDPAHKGENGTADENTPTFSQYKLTPHRLPVVGEISKQLALQSPSVTEQWFRNYLATKVAKAREKAIINGDGVGENPLGILNTSGIGAVAIGTNGGTPTHAHIEKLFTAIASEDADEGMLNYLTTPEFREKLRLTKIDAGSGQFIWDRKSPNELNGYGAQISNLLPKNITKGSGTDLHPMLFGNWADLYLSTWGGLDIVANPYTKAKEGIIELIVTMFHDCAVNRFESFSVISDADLS